MDKVSIVIPAYIITPDILILTKQTIEGLLFKTKNINDAEIILVDDGSNKKNIDYLKRIFPQIKISSNETNQGFAKSVNNGIRLASNDLILLLNNDIVIKESGWLINLIDGMNHFNYDVASVKQSILDEGYNYIPDAQRHTHKNCTAHFAYPVGWCLLVKRQVFETAGMLPENYGRGFFEDSSWAWYIKKNYRNIKMGVVENIDKIQIQHLEHQTFNSAKINISEQYKINREIFLNVLEGKIDLLLPKLEKRA